MLSRTSFRAARLAALLRVLLLVALACPAAGARPVVASSVVSAGRIGGGGTDVGTAVARDPSGALYLIGYFAGTADFDPGPGTVSLAPAGNIDAFVAKLDPSGALVWARRLGGSLADQGIGVAADASGVYVTGTFEGAVDLDPGPGTANVTSQGGTDVFLLKLDGDGNFAWGRSFGGIVSDSGSAFALAGGALYLVGDYRGTVDLDPGPGVASFTSANGTTDIFVSKFDLAGSLVWAKAVRGSQEEISRGVASDGTGVYVTGIFSGTTDFDPGPGTVSLAATSNSYDVFVLRLDSSGGFSWVRSIGAADTEISSGIRVDGSGVYITGYFNGVVDFDPGSGTTTATAMGAAFDAFLLKLDLGGDFAWVRRFGNENTDVPFALEVNPSGVYVTGYLRGTVDFDPGSGSFPLTSAGKDDAFVARLTSAGDFVTAYRLGGSDADVGRSLALNGSTVYLAGTFEKTADFDPGPGSATLTSAGAGDIFLSVVAAESDPPVGVADAYTVAAGATLTVPPRGVLANDANPGGSGAALQAVLAAPPSRGTLDLRPDGSFTYVPNAGVTGSDQFTYRATTATASSNPTTVTLTITAIPTLTVSRAGSGNGAVTGSGISCGVDCQEQYPSGTQVTLTAAPATGTDISTFAGWGGACAPAGTSQTCTLTIDADKAVTATFGRVNAGVQVGPGPTESGAKTLIATLTARAGCGPIQHIHFGTVGVPFDNARISISSPSGGPSGQTVGFLYTPPAGITSVSITIQRVAQSGGATVKSIQLHDGCGEWLTLVGGGPDAFR